MCTCNNGAGNRARTVSPKRFLSRVRAALSWAAPTITLALIPKCPACLAAYVALWTGLGLSFKAASHIRTTLIALSITALIVLAACQLRRFLRPRQAA